MRLCKFTALYSIVGLCIAATSTAASAPACTSGGHIVNNRACWVSCNVTRPGGNYKQSRTGSLDACINLCASDSACVTAQYRNDNLFCYLKSVRNQAAASDVADTTDCDYDYTPTSSNCPTGKTYKLRDTGTNWYASTGTSSPAYIVFSKTLSKSTATSYQFFIDSKGACSFRPVNTASGPFISQSNPPSPQDNTASWIRFDAAAVGSIMQPISCIKTPSSQLDCHLENYIIWDRFILFSDSDGSSRDLLLGSPGFPDGDSRERDPNPTLVLEEI